MMLVLIFAILALWHSQSGACWLAGWLAARQAQRDEMMRQRSFW